ncbi:MAG: RcnB family protein [Sphingobium sp.]
MRKLVLVGLAAGLGGLAIPAAHAEDAGAALATSAMAQAGASHIAPPRGAAWGRRVNGRWSAGASAPGGWNGYYRPVAGWSLPSYWINPAYYISDWRGYGLPAPAEGYGWSRYYDDAVLTDRYGRVSDVRYGYDWDRYGGYEDAYDVPPPPQSPPPLPYEADRYRRDRSGNTVAGAVAGGVIGGVAGNLIAGRGNRTAGTIVGAGVGAIAGAAIGNASSRPKRPKHLRAPDYADGYGYDYGYDAPQGRPGRAPASYDGRWVGTWQGRDGSTYEGAYDGRFDGDVRSDYYREGAAFAPPAPLPYAPLPAPAYGYGYGYGYGYSAGSYSSYGVDYVAPTVVTTTVTTEETTYAARKAVARKVVRKARPKPRVVCCPCGC